jgi:putative Mg2+ transporter-C (MgtC) family protein
MPSHPVVTFDFSQAWISLVKIILTYLLTFPVGWEREREAHSVGVRTFPIVAIASCGYVLLVISADPSSQSRVLQGLIAGIGFVGGGAILKEGANVRGTATAASIWGTGVVGAAVAMGRYEIAVILSALNFLTLKVLWRYKQKLNERAATHEDDKSERRG